jgi:carbon-monoxide dehydrogenase large subunit
VKWTGTRAEHFLSDNHARDALIEGELALDGEGNFLAVRVTVLTALGAYCSYVAPITPIRNTTLGLPLVYKTPLVGARHKMVATNCAPVGPYRGAGREQSALVVESLIDQAARELSADPVALRRRNLLPKEALPYVTPTGRCYDSGDFEGLLDKALGLAEWDRFAERAAASAAQGRLRGRGVALFIEAVGGVPFETAQLRFEDDGTLLCVVATQSSGQGHETSFSQVIAERLGVPPERVRLRQGDGGDVPRGMGSFASRSMIMAGSAISLACDQAIAKGKAYAARLFGCPESAIEFADGLFRARGANISADVLQLAELIRNKHAGERGLDSQGEFTVKDFHFPSGCHVCEVEIDPDTGQIAIDRYAAVDDAGVIVNPMIVHGQIHGGVAQGLGQALCEDIVYDRAGQLLTGSFQDYALPRASDLPEPALAFQVAPSPSNPLGVKGCGEAGVTGSIAVVSNAVHDAMWRAGRRARLDMPFTPEKVWRALRE